MSSDPFGRAIRDFHRGEQDEPLVDRDGEATREHPIERFYFEEFDAADDHGRWLESHLRGPLLDIGAGAGRHALHFQRRFETVAVDVSDHLVETMRGRGVTDARRVNMFSLRERFDRDRFRAALSIGTQLGLAGSVRGLREFLGDLAFVTTPDARAVVDCHDPDREGAADLFGYRPDPTPGLARRAFHFEYEGDVGETLLLRLFSPDRLREAAAGTGWTVAEVDRAPGEGDPYYRAALRKA